MPDNFQSFKQGGYVGQGNAAKDGDAGYVMFPDILPRYTVEEYARACKAASQVGKISIKVNVSGSNGSAKG